MLYSKGKNVHRKQHIFEPSNFITTPSIDGFTMSKSNGSGFFHHFMPKTLPCIFFPPISPSSGSDHILNLSASISKHCPMPKSPPIKSVKCDSVQAQDPVVSKRVKVEQEGDTSPSSAESAAEDCSKECSTRVDMNCNDVTKAKFVKSCDAEDNSESGSDILDTGGLEEENLTEIEVDDGDNDNCDDGDDETGMQSQNFSNKDEKKTKPLAFGIDRILSYSEEIKDQKSPAPHLAERSSPCSHPSVVTNLSTKSSNSSEAIKIFRDPKDDKHHSILSKLKLCTSENQKRSTSTSSSLPYFHHSYSPFQHHHHHSAYMNSIIQTTNPTGSSTHHSPHHHHQHQHHQNHHPLSNCSECLFLRRFCGGSSGSSRASIPSSSSSSANNVAANNMQFSSSMATPCGPTSSPISASFTWMANPSIYDSSAIISPVAGYNPHIPLQPSFGMSASSYSTLATIQQCNTTGSSGRRKRSWSRAVFSNLQRKGLEKRFQIQKYITKPDRRQLAATLGLTDAQVKVWFQNRRMKWRHSKEGKVSSGTGEAGSVTPSSSPVTSTTSSKVDGAMKDKKP